MQARTLAICALLCVAGGAFAGKTWGDTEAHNRFPVLVQYTVVSEDGTHFDADGLLAARAETELRVNALLEARGQRPDAIFVCELTPGGTLGYAHRNYEGCDQQFVSERWRAYREQHPYSPMRDVYEMIFSS